MSRTNIKNILVIWSGNINKISVGSNYIKSYLNSLESYTHKYYEVKQSVELFSGKLKRIGSLFIISDFLLLCWIPLHVNRHVKSIISSLREEKFSSIWFFANSIESILIGYKLSCELKESGVKFNVCVWDSFEHITKSKRVSKLTINKAFSAYKMLLNNASNITCISKGMENHLNSKFSLAKHSLEKKLIVLPFPVTSMPNQNNLINKNKGHNIDIVFVGSTYCWKEWNSFIIALDEVKWVLGSNRIILHVYGSPNIRSYLYKDREGIVYYESIRHDDLIHEISKYDFAYLPYFYDENKRIVAETSLPGKLSTYIQSQLPVIFHGPSYSNAAVLIKNYNLGVVIENKNEIKINDLIINLRKINKNNFDKCFSEFYDAKNYIPKLSEIM